MARTFRSALIDGMDAYWAPVVERLEGLTDDEFLWEPIPDCWTVHPSEDGAFVDWLKPDPEPATFTTIAWRVWHIGPDCLDAYSNRVFDHMGSNYGDTRNWTLSAEEGLAELTKSWLVFRNGMAELDDDGLLTPLGQAWGPFAERSHADLILHALREVAHHGAEIALLRDLYANR